MSENSGMTLKLTQATIDGWKTETEGQRHFSAAMGDVLRTLDGVSADEANRLRDEWLVGFGRLKAVTSKTKTSGGVFKFSGEADFPKAGMRPPIVMALHEAAGHVFKLRKLGAFPAKELLQIDMAAIRAAHGARWERLP